MPLLDAHHESVTTQIYIGNADVTGYALWSQCQFQTVASSEPGNCTIVLRDHMAVLGFIGGELIRLYVNDDLMWQGYAFMVERGYMFDAYGERRWVIRGVDLNILLKKLILYNHADPRKSLDGGGHYQRDPSNGQVIVPQNTPDKDYIAHMLNDTDWDTITRPTLATYMTEVAKLNPDAKFEPPQPGITLYDFLVDTSSHVIRDQQGSVIWYMNPQAYLVWRKQDEDTAPFYVSDDPAATTTMINGIYGINVRNLTVSTDISNIKNDVLIFTGNLDPTVDSPQEHLLYKHNQLTASVNQFGRFQYSEILGSDWLQGAINVRSTKILYQEATPATQASFTTYRHGFFPGQLLLIQSKFHRYWTWDVATSDLVDSDTVYVPVRAINMRWVTPSVIEYSVQCSFNTQDPWGLILALKRPANRGLVPPTFFQYDRTQHPDAPLLQPTLWMMVREVPEQLSGNKWRCSYAYIRNSLSVFVDGVRVFGIPDPQNTATFLETDPPGGVFEIGAAYAGKAPIVEYHCAGPRG